MDEILDANSDLRRGQKMLRNHLYGRELADFEAAMKSGDAERAQSILVKAIDTAMKESPNQSLKMMKDRIQHGNRDASMSQKNKDIRDKKIDHMRGRR